MKLKYLKRFKDCRGKPRVYFRRKGQRDIPLPGAEGSPEFMIAYGRALEGTIGRMVIVSPGAKVKREPTISDVVEMYYKTPAFTQLSPLSARTYRGSIEQLRREHGDKRIAMLERRHVQEIIDARMETPGAAQNMLKVLRRLLHVAIQADIIAVDPTSHVELSYQTDGHHSWTDDEVARFRSRWAEGTLERLALELLIYTGQRRGDIIKLGRQNINAAGDLVIRQSKTGKALKLPVHHNLARLLPTDRLLFLVAPKGSPFKPDHFTRWFGGASDAAGLPTACTPHGLRKHTATVLAELGCTPSEIAAVTGHATLAEVERYTKAADQLTMARKAIGRMRQSD